MTGLSIPAGVVLFFVVNVVVGVIANPLFPNQAGPMPGWLPYGMLAVVAALLVAAAISAGWRRVAAGFLLAYGAVTLASHGELTTSWTLAAQRLDPTREDKRRIAEAARFDAASAERRQARAAELDSPAARERLAREAFGAMRCAFAYRDQHPREGLATTLEELSAGGPGCGRWSDAMMGRHEGYRVSIASRTRRAGEPVTDLSLVLEPHPELGREFPRFVADARGIVTGRYKLRSQPAVVASPVPALLTVRACLRSRPHTGSREELPSLRQRLESIPACWQLGGGLAADTTAGTLAMIMCLSADSKVACTSDGGVASYRVRYEPVGEGETAGFVLRAEGEGRMPVPRRYLVTADGAVHATSAPRDATEADPVVDACERYANAPCH